jgi:hypothetical protein
MDLETLVSSCFNHLTRLVAREDFIRHFYGLFMNIICQWKSAYAVIDNHFKIKQFCQNSKKLNLDSCCNI